MAIEITRLAGDVGSMTLEELQAEYMAVCEAIQRDQQEVLDQYTVELSKITDAIKAL